MQRFAVRHSLLPALAVSLVASLVVGVAANAAGEHGVPFRAQISLVSQSDTGPLAKCGSLPNMGYTASYQGIATHLGRVAESETVCMDYVHFAFPNLPYTVYGTYTAANGDLLSVFAWGNYNVVTSTGTDGGFTFTGGTGRFVHAHGGGSGDLIVDSSGNVVGVIQTGTLFYDSSDRSS